MLIIAPSILACDFARLGEEIQRTNESAAKYIHIDVMDGMFVPNLTIGPQVVASIRKYSEKTFDVHLMIHEPIRYVKEFIKAGADIVTVHVEACSDVSATLSKIHACGAKAGLSIKPNTDPSILLPYLSLVDMLLVMTVEPGFGGQSFIYKTVENINFLKRQIEASDRLIPIEVDGGITTKTIGIARKAGAEIFVAGSAVYGKKDLNAAVEDLIKAASIADQ